MTAVTDRIPAGTIPGTPKGSRLDPPSSMPMDVRFQESEKKPWRPGRIGNSCPVDGPRGNLGDSSHTGWICAWQIQSDANRSRSGPGSLRRGSGNYVLSLDHFVDRKHEDTKNEYRISVTSDVEHYDLTAGD